MTLLEYYAAIPSPHWEVSVGTRNNENRKPYKWKNELKLYIHSPSKAVFAYDAKSDEAIEM